MTDDRDTIRRMLSIAAKAMRKDQRREFRAFMAELKPRARKKVKVHSWRRKAKNRSAQINLFGWEK